MATHLVTGGAGFIGSHLVSALVARREAVRVFDNFSTGKFENIQPSLDSIEVVNGSLEDMPMVRKAMQGVDYVLHQGALVSVPESIADPLACNQVNVVGTLNVLAAARDAGVKRVVVASSCAVYGNHPALPKNETMLPAPMSPYAASKLAGEHYCQAFSEVYGLSTIALRYFNVFGPRQDPTSPYAAVIPKFITVMLNGQPPQIYGDGLQSRDFVYVSDVVRANLLAIEAPASVSGVFNVACQQRYTLLELVEALQEVIGVELRPEFGPAQPGDVKHSQADIRQARLILGYEPQVSFLEGLRKTVLDSTAEAIAAYV